MILNMKSLLRLLKEVFNNNQTEMAKAFGVERSHLNKVLRSNGKGAGATMCGAIIKYCNRNNLNVDDYIFFN
ncbi:MAG: hypothetical protein IJH39_01150 [Clostridia bacterium]|nr:hypothetical protein [Clostridia bacterium]